MPMVGRMATAHHANKQNSRGKSDEREKEKGSTLLRTASGMLSALATKVTKREKAMEAAIKEEMKELSGGVFDTGMVSQEFNDVMASMMPDDIDGLDSHAHTLVDDPRFEIAIMTIVVMNSIQMGLALSLTGELWDNVWSIAEHVFTSIFTIEMCLKIAVMRCQYFKDLWCLLDFSLVWMAIVDNWIMSGSSNGSSMMSVRLLRLVRIGRMARLVSMNASLSAMVAGIAEALKAMVPIAGLLSLCIYAFSLILVDVMNGAPGYDDELHFDVDDFFGTLPRAWLTLFNIVIMAEWGEIIRPVGRVQPWLVVFFMIFVALGSFGIINVIIGVICEKMNMAYEQVKEHDAAANKVERMASVQNLVKQIANTDSDGNGLVTAAEFECSDLKTMLRDIELPHGFTSEELHLMLDFDGSGEVSIAEFITCMFRMIHCNEFQHICLNTLNMNHIKRLSHQNHVVTRQQVQQLESKVDVLVESMQILMQAGGVDCASRAAELTSAKTESAMRELNAVSSGAKAPLSQQPDSERSPVPVEMRKFANMSTLVSPPAIAGPRPEKSRSFMNVIKPSGSVNTDSGPTGDSPLEFSELDSSLRSALCAPKPAHRPSGDDGDTAGGACNAAPKIDGAVKDYLSTSHGILSFGSRATSPSKSRTPSGSRERRVRAAQLSKELPTTPRGR